MKTYGYNFTPYRDKLKIRIKRQKGVHEVEYYDGVRISRDTIPAGKHAYQTRHSDKDCCQPVTILPENAAVIVNFCGTIVTDYPLDVKEEIKLMYVSWV